MLTFQSFLTKNGGVMWEYGFLNEKFEILIKSKDNPCADPLLLSQLLQSIDFLTSEMKQKCLIAENNNQLSESKHAQTLNIT